MAEIKKRKRTDESKILVSEREGEELRAVLLRLIKQPRRCSVRVDLGDGGALCDVTLVEVQKVTE
jgi:hypothetical protein